MRNRRTLIGATVATILLAVRTVPLPCQTPAVRAVGEEALREYAGAYQWRPDAFLYLQLWSEFTGTNQLVAFDESGEVRTLYPTDRDRFFAGPAAADPTAVESSIEFQRDAAGRIISLTWCRDGAPPRVARRAESEKREDIHFSSGNVRLAGTLISPNTRGRHPAIILVP